MIVLPPFKVTPAMLVSSTAVDEPAWVESTTYALDAVVSHNYRRCVSLQAGNLAKTPGAEPLWWFDDGPCNSMAAFDESPSTPTLASGDLVMTLAPGTRFTDLALLGIKARSVTLTLRDGPDGEIFYGPSTRTLIHSGGTYWAFCFLQIAEMPAITETSWHGLPSVSGAHVTLEFSGLADTGVALVTLGRGIYIGEAEYGFTNAVEDRGRYYTDNNENAVALKRGHTKGASGVINATRQQHNSLIKFSADYVGVPCVWIVSPSDESLSGTMVYGRFLRATVAVPGPTHSTYSVEISGNV